MTGVNITVDVNGGMLYGTATLNSEGVVSNGKVTGGTGSFKGATGEFTVKNLTARTAASGTDIAAKSSSGQASASNSITGANRSANWALTET